MLLWRCKMGSIDCGILLKEINDRIARQANSSLKENQLTLSQLRYLEYLASKKESAILFKEFEQHFHVSQPTVVGILSRLSKKGLIKVDPVPRSKAKMASLTDKGLKELKKAAACRNATEINLLAPLSEKERVIFKKLLMKIAACKE
jgi:DNA-binding MarR family transcriptional regulator